MTTRRSLAGFAVAIGIATTATGCLFKPGPPSGDNGDAGASCNPGSAVTPPTPVDMGATAIAAGGSHACMVGVDHNIWCWGDNGVGELGDTQPGTPFNGTPMIATTTPNAWQAVAAGLQHTCGLTLDGNVYCWGANANNESSATNAETVGVSPVNFGTNKTMGIYAGTQGSCAIDTANQLWCWGDVHDPAVYSSPTHLKPAGLDGWSSVSIGDDHTCAINADMHTYCWGSNSALQLGTPASGMVPSSNATAAVNKNLSTVSAAANFSCGTNAAGELHCWGAPGEPSSIPEPANTTDFVVATGMWLAVSTGQDHTCALRAGSGSDAGDVFCFGYGTNGANGIGFVSGDYDPSKQALTNVTAIASGDTFSCALKSDGHVWCWGSNIYGEIGDGHVATQRTPSRVDLPCMPVLSLAAGDDHVCAVLADHTIHCWGSNYMGESGSDSAELEGSPVVASPLPYDQVVAGADHTCARRSDAHDEIDCWGDDSQHQLGAGSNMSPTGDWDRLSAVGVATCAIAGSATAYCWGDVADPTSSGGSAAAISASDGEPIVQAVVGEHLVALVGASDVREWGGASACSVGSTQLTADGTSPTSNVLTFDAGSATIHRVSLADSNSSHGCATYGDGQLTCWGTNNRRQVAPVERDCQVQTAVTTGGPWLGPVATGGSHTCAITMAGQIFCWGSNDGYEIGSKIDLEGGTGTPELAVDGTWSDVVTMGNDTCAVSADQQSVYCWGLNIVGEVGNGFAFADHPVQTRPGH